jgi:hypothetical protein
MSMHGLKIVPTAKTRRIAGFFQRLQSLQCNNVMNKHIANELSKMDIGKLQIINGAK